MAPGSHRGCTPSPSSGPHPGALWGTSEPAGLPQEAFGKRITNARIFAASPESCAFTHTLVAPSLGPSWLSAAGLLEVWSFPVRKFREKNLLNHPASHRANQKPQNLEKAGRGRKANGPHCSVDLFLPLCCSFLSSSTKHSASLQLAGRTAFPPICILWSGQT